MGSGLAEGVRAKLWLENDEPQCERSLREVAGSSSGSLLCHLEGRVPPVASMRKKRKGKKKSTCWFFLRGVLVTNGLPHHTSTSIVLAAT